MLKKDLTTSSGMWGLWDSLFSEDDEVTGCCYGKRYD